MEVIFPLRILDRDGRTFNKLFYDLFSKTFHISVIYDRTFYLPFLSPASLSYSHTVLEGGCGLVGLTGRFTDTSQH